MTIYCPTCESAKVYRVNLVDKTVYENVRRYDPKNPQNSLVRINEDGYYGSEPGPPAPQITAGYCAECSSLWAPITAKGFSTIELGDVFTVGPNEDASVENVGDNVNAILTFSIPRGQTGPQGATGNPATVTIGNSTTSAPGSNVSVTNSGTTSNAVFNFSIPRGDTGATGPQGVPGDITGAPAATLTEVGSMPSTAADLIAIANVTNSLQYRLENNGNTFSIPKSNLIDVDYTTASLAPEAIETFSLSLGQCGILFSITVTGACWVTMYTSETSRTNDEGRLIATDPAAGSGVVWDVYPATATTIVGSPSVMFFNPTLGSETSFFKVVNKGTTGTIAINIKGFRLN